MMEEPMNFAVVERDFIRSRVLPEFDWVVYSTPSRINPVRRPVGELRIAMVTTAGVHGVTDSPFDVRSRTGDPSYREIPGGIPINTLKLSHVGYNIRKVSEDINCVFPLERLRELEVEGIIGSLNHRHFSFMGYIPIVDSLLQNSGPAVAQKLLDDAVDLVLLAPA